MKYFRPTKRKVIVSIVVIFVVYAGMALMIMFPEGVCGMPLCLPDDRAKCADITDYSFISPYHYIPDGSGCVGCCDKTSLPSALTQLLFFMAPGIIVYILYSIFQLIAGMRNKNESY